MMKQQLITQATELAESLHLEPPEFSEEGLGMLRFPEGIELNLQYLAADESCLLFVILGQLPERNRENIIEYAMTSNLFWRRTSGATLAYEKEYASMVLQDRLPLLELEPHILRETVEGMLETAELWTAIVKKSNEVAEEGNQNEAAKPLDAAQLMQQFDPRQFA
ncbi:type III secretion system chaperone [Acanthopleuribacter pedis]|uniref:Type III secretion system chaperone n=1 Tax=Acanthopleuribacter pedis TaxID=442870 RepID=A0A8J7QED3_9BACT|nr:type III secretion system chaperone [Acanthopleuribacter pedis]MBO1322689.1 type III secretion system chaperone [Acanthopleuribacter pedis]